MLAVVLSVVLATPRIAIASGAAFLVAQLLDIGIFARLRDRAWWLPPFVSSVISSALDTAIFFSLAFYCGAVPGLGMTITEMLGQIGIADACIALPWVNLAVADYLVKLALAALSIAPYGASSPSCARGCSGPPDLDRSIVESRDMCKLGVCG